MSLWNGTGTFFQFDRQMTNQSEPIIQNKCCLIVIDGWGISPDADSEGDAIRNAKTPVMTRLTEQWPSTSLAAHGLAVGLPEGLM